MVPTTAPAWQIRQWQTWVNLLLERMEGHERTTRRHHKERVRPCTGERRATTPNGECQDGDTTLHLGQKWSLKRNTHKMGVFEMNLHWRTNQPPPLAWWESCTSGLCQWWCVEWCKCQTDHCKHIGGRRQGREGGRQEVIRDIQNINETPRDNKENKRHHQRHTYQQWYARLCK